MNQFFKICVCVFVRERESERERQREGEIGSVSPEPCLTQILVRFIHSPTNGALSGLKITRLCVNLTQRIHPKVEVELAEPLAMCFSLHPRHSY